jgi:serine/threonine protein kinase
MVFELLDMDLYRMMQMRKLNDDPFSHEEIRHIINQIAIALDYVHNHGFFHRDIKPGNVLVDTDGRARLLDFGIAKFLDPDAAATDTAVACKVHQGEARPRKNEQGVCDVKTAHKGRL